MASPRKARRRKRAPVESRPQRILALDSSSACIGYAVFEQEQVLAYGKFIPTGGRGTHGEKLAGFRAWLMALVAEVVPDRVCFELPFHGRRRNTFGVLCRYIGVIEAVHFEALGREVGDGDAIPAHLIKRAIGAPRGQTHEENKRRVVRMVNERYGLRLRYADDKKISQDDIADAIAVGWAWYALHSDAEEAT